MHALALLVGTLCLGQTPATPPSELPLRPGEEASQGSPVTAPSVTPAASPEQPAEPARSPQAFQEIGGPTPRDPERSAPLVPVDSSTPGRSIAQRLVAEFEPGPLSEEQSAVGLKLHDVLAASTDRSVQRSRVETYWNLWAALARHRDCRELRSTLSEASAVVPAGEAATEPTASTALAAHVASCEAESHELAVRVLELTSALAASTQQGTPLPVDRPHVGAYRTQFNTVFAGGTAPAEAFRLHRTLPLRQRAVEVRAAAVEAARQAFEQALAAYKSGTLAVGSLVARAEELNDARGAFLDAVRVYNHEIAQYAMLAAPPSAGPDVLVSMLIKTETPVRPAAATGTVPEGSPTIIGEPQFIIPSAPFQATPGGPVVAPPPGTAPFPPGRQPRSILVPESGPTPARPPAESPPASTPTPKASDQSGFRPSREAGYPPSGAEGSTAPGRRDLGWKPFGRENTPEDTGSRVAAFVETSAPAAESEELFAAYADLTDLPPALRTQRLAERLHAADRSLPTNAEEISITEFLSASRSSDLLQLIRAYWRASEDAARYRLAAATAGRLRSVCASADVATAAGDADSPRLRAAQLMGQGEVLEAQAALLEAQWRLTTLSGRPVHGAWLHPATPPHGGHYLPKLEAQPDELARDVHLQTLAASIPELHAAIEHRCDAVLASGTPGWGSSCDAAVDSLARHREEMERFLGTLTDYNLAIANYAVGVLPGDSSIDELVGSLVVRGRADDSS